MCIAIIKPAGVSLPENFDDQIRASAHTNDDGLGLALWRQGDNKITVEKGYINDTEGFINKLKDLDVKADDILLVHARIRTDGATNDKNCHPFIVSKKIEECTLTSTETKKHVVIHNGVLHKYKDFNSPYSDTCKFANEYLTNTTVNYLIKNFPELITGVRDLYLITDTKNKKYISFTNDFGGKIAILYPNGYLFTYGDFKEDQDTQDGMLYSNASYKNTKFRNVGGTNVPMISQNCSVNNRWAVEKAAKSARQLAFTYDSKSSDTKQVELDTKEAFYYNLIRNMERDKEDYAFITDDNNAVTLFGSFSKVVKSTIFTYKGSDADMIWFYVNGDPNTVFEYKIDVFVENLVIKRFRPININDMSLEVNSIYARQLYTDMTKSSLNIMVLPGKTLKIYTKTGMREIILKNVIKGANITESTGCIIYKGEEPKETLKLYKTFNWNNILAAKFPKSGTKGIVRNYSDNSIYCSFKFIDENDQFRIYPIHRDEIIRHGNAVKITKESNRENDIALIKALNKDVVKTATPRELDEAMKVQNIYVN
jgi:predicted glutamine amidotransferase